MSMNNAPYVNSNYIPYMNIGYEVPESSRYVNQQMNRTNKPSSYINLSESEIGSYAALQHADASKSNYKQLKLKSWHGLSFIQMFHYVCDLLKPLKIKKNFQRKFVFQMTFMD